MVFTLFVCSASLENGVCNRLSVHEHFATEGSKIVGNFDAEGSAQQDQHQIQRSGLETRLQVRVASVSLKLPPIFFAESQLLVIRMAFRTGRSQRILVRVAKRNE